MAMSSISCIASTHGASITCLLVPRSRSNKISVHGSRPLPRVHSSLSSSSAQARLDSRLRRTCQSHGEWQQETTILCFSKISSLSGSDVRSRKHAQNRRLLVNSTQATADSSSTCEELVQELDVHSKESGDLGRVVSDIPEELSGDSQASQQSTSYAGTAEQGEDEVQSRDSKISELLMLRNFERHVSSAAGSVIVRPLTGRYMDDAVDLLTDSFADLFGITYRPLLRLQVKLYLQQRLLMVPLGITLVGLLPSQDSETDETALQVVATVELSFSQKGRPSFTLNPPADAPYLCNMAVSHAYRRQRVGAAVLGAAEDLTAALGHSEIYLHCRLCDAAPYELYRKAGYQVKATDNMLSAILFFQRRRHLMGKTLESMQTAA